MMVSTHQPGHPTLDPRADRPDDLRNGMWRWPHAGAGLVILALVMLVLDSALVYVWAHHA